MVYSATMDMKWFVYGERGIAPPVTYGVVPNGAEQTWPFGGGSPPPLASGDIIYVNPVGGVIPYQSMMCTAVGQLSVP